MGVFYSVGIRVDFVCFWFWGFEGVKGQIYVRKRISMKKSLMKKSQNWEEKGMMVKGNSWEIRLGFFFSRKQFFTNE